MSTDQGLRQRVASEIRAEMARQRRTGTELAKVLGCSQQSASRRINGGRGLDLDDLPLIAAWLEIPMTDLLGITSPPGPRADASPAA